MKTRTKFTAKQREALLERHPLLRKLDSLALEVAFQIIENHKRIRVYRTGKEIRLSRDAMHSYYREVFILN